MRIFKWIVTVVLFCVVLTPAASASGKGKALRWLYLLTTEDFEKIMPKGRWTSHPTLRLAGQERIIPHGLIGSKTLLQRAAAPGQKAGVSVANRWQEHLPYYMYSQHLNPVHLERTIVQAELSSFPAHYNSFPRAWEYFVQDGGKLGTLEVILQAAYGRGKQFEGFFLETYPEVVALLETELTEGIRAEEAVAKAYRQGLKKERGFFVIQVKQTSQHPQDVLLLDFKKAKTQGVQFISLNKSIVAWVQGHPFEMELASRRKFYFGAHLPKIYPELSVDEKEAFLALDMLGEEPLPFADKQYDRALQHWIDANKREPMSYLVPPKALPKKDAKPWEEVQPGQEAQLGKEAQPEQKTSAFPFGQQPGNTPVFFYNKGQEIVPFSSLSYERQLEVLMWAWKTHHMTPQKVLAALSN